MSEFMSPLSKMEKRRPFEVFKKSQLSRDKDVLLCKNLSVKVLLLSIAKYGPESIAVPRAMLNNKKCCTKYCKSCNT